jgi:Ni,Fe-hydrogenase maturation factor
MTRLFLAIGNPLRGDDGVAARVLELLTAPGERIEVHQLTPEIAAEIAPFDHVVFIDADAGANAVRLEPVQARATDAPALSHHTSAATIVEAAQCWFGFTGQAWLCRLPACEFPMGFTLSRESEEASHLAAALLDSRFGFQ